MQKKAQLEISFNWIFVLLVGGAILVFFIAIINSQVGGNTIDTSNKIAARMEAIISVVQQNPGSVQVLSALRSPMKFSCDIDGHSYIVEGGTIRSYLDTELVFTPAVLGTKTPLVAWTRTARMPHPIGSLLYLADKNTQYVFIVDQYVSTQEIFDTFPRNFSKKNITLSELANYRDEGFDKYIIIANADSDVNNYMNLRIAKKASLVAIQRDPGYYATQYGTVKFYSKIPQATPEDEIPYIGPELLYGAIVSGDASLYRCSLQKVIDMTIIANNLSILRMEDMKQQYTPGDTCYNLYMDALAIDTFRQMNDNLKLFETQSMSIMEKIQDIDDYNTEMLTQDCPLIY